MIDTVDYGVRAGLPRPAPYTHAHGFSKDAVEGVIPSAQSTPDVSIGIYPRHELLSQYFPVNKRLILGEEGATRAPVTRANSQRCL
jgi:hypothetical protein